MDRSGFQGWLDRYVEAWKTYDRDAIGSLFAEDAHYSYHPYDDDVVGRDAIVDDWLKNQDEPGTWEAHYEPYAVDGDTCVALGWSHYWDVGQSHDEKPTAVYTNAYFVKFAQDGTASEFREFFIEPREAARARRDREIAEAVEKARAEWRPSDSGSLTAAEPASASVQG